MNDNTKKTIAGMFMVVPGIYLAEELILGHSLETHIAEKILDTTPVFTQNVAFSGSVTTYSGPANFVYYEQDSYHQTT